MNNKVYKGRVALRISKALHRQASRAAKRDGVSLNQWIVEAAALAVGEEEQAERLLRVPFLVVGTPNK